MANFLVTGGAGFIGSNIVEALIEKNHSVRVLDNFSSGKKNNIEPFLSQIEVVEGSITNLDDCLNACDGIDLILHQAAIPSVPVSVKDPLKTLEANICGTNHMLYAAKEKKCKRLVYAASSSAYGEQEVEFKVETLVPQPLSPYAVHKLTGEYLCAAFANCYTLETVCLRYFNVFGPKQDPHSEYGAVIPKFIDAVLNDQQPIIFGDGHQSRDFTYVRNNVEGNILAALADNIPAKGDVYNLACGDNISLLELLEKVNQILGKNIEPIHKPPRQGDVRHSRADNSKATENLQFTPEVSFEEGLKRTIEWYQEQND